MFEVMFNEAIADPGCGTGTCEITSGCFNSSLDSNSWCITIPGSSPWYCPWCHRASPVKAVFAFPNRTN
jgi:hypothetical protein